MRKNIRNIIINADDYGLTKGVSRGILTLYNAGKISSCSVMANCEDADWHFERLKKSGLPAGIHLNLSAGKPVLSADKVSTLVKKDGSFISAESLILRERLGKIDHEQLRLELKAQLYKMREYLEPDHFDGHRHFYFFSENILRTVFSIMDEEGIKNTRIPYEGRLYRDSGIYFILRTAILNHSTEKAFDIALKKGFRFPKYFRGQQYTGDWSTKRFINIFSNIHDGTEVMIHPGFYDKKLKNTSSLNISRQEELELFLKERLPNDIKLSSFAELF